MKKILIVFLILKSVFVFSQNDANDEVFTIVEQMPTFPGGNEAMMKYIKDKIKSIGYPQKEKEAGISGVSYVTFVVDKEGNVTDAKLLKGVPDGPGYDLIAVDVVREMPKWVPGKQNGRTVSVQYNLPIKFTAKKDENIASADYVQGGASTKITIFKPEDNKPTNVGTLQNNPDLHCLKWNYSLLTRGIFLMNYEFQFQKKLAAEVGLGITYRDLIFETSHSSYFDNTSFKANYNFCGEAGIRFYPRDFDDFEGLYLSPMISYRKYSLTLQDGYSNNPYINTISSFSPGYNFVDIQLKFGYQYESLWDDDILGDFYVGVAFRNATINSYSEVHNSTTGGTDYVSTQTKIQFPQLLFGFKIGVPF